MFFVAGAELFHVVIFLLFAKAEVAVLDLFLHFEAFLEDTRSCGVLFEDGGRGFQGLRLGRIGLNAYLDLGEVEFYHLGHAIIFILPSDLYISYEKFRLRLRSRKRK